MKVEEAGEQGRKGEREKGRKGEREKGRKGEREKGSRGARRRLFAAIGDGSLIDAEQNTNGPRHGPFAQAPCTHGRGQGEPTAPDQPTKAWEERAKNIGPRVRETANRGGNARGTKKFGQGKLSLRGLSRVL